MVWKVIEGILAFIGGACLASCIGMAVLVAFEDHRYGKKYGKDGNDKDKG